MSRWLALLCLISALPAAAEEPRVQVLVAAVDLAAGQVVKAEDLSQRGAPATLVTSSVVKPESASYVINQRLRAPVLRGQLLLWWYFETVGTDNATACAAAVREPGSAREQVARARAAVLKKN